MQVIHPPLASAGVVCAVVGSGVDSLFEFISMVSNRHILPVSFDILR
jgi:hypothetical protein